MEQWLARCIRRLFVLCGSWVRVDASLMMRLLLSKNVSLPAVQVVNILSQSDFYSNFLKLRCLVIELLHRRNNRSFLMAIIVEKSKKCLDFSFTLFIVHLLIVCAYDGFPSTWDWWIVHICSMITMVLLGEYLCARREMEDIPLLQL